MWVALYFLAQAWIWPLSIYIAYRSTHRFQ